MSLLSYDPCPQRPPSLTGKAYKESQCGEMSVTAEGHVRCGPILEGLRDTACSGGARYLRGDREPLMVKAQK